MQVLLFLFIFGYSIIILRYWHIWNKMPLTALPQNYIPQTALSLIIPVRNEASTITNLLKQITAQNYPTHLFKVLVIDDQSEDNTAEVVQNFKSSSELNIKLVPLEAGVGKKAGIKAGIAAAQGELLVFTDGDCQVGPNWLALIEYIYVTKNAKFVSGPVCFNNTKGIFQKMQLVEFAALIGVGGSSIAAGSPNMCNGANLAYTKQIFEEVNGFAGNEHIASGDDEFLLHKIHKLYPESIFFLKAPEAIVYTGAKTKIADFFAQRVRWASKWPAYTKLSVKLLATLVFGVNLLLFICGVLSIVQLFSIKIFMLALAIKFIVDLLFLKSLLQFFGKPNYLIYAFPLQILNIPYVLITAILGLRGSYNWKGREVNKS